MWGDEAYSIFLKPKGVSSISCRFRVRKYGMFTPNLSGQSVSFRETLQQRFQICEVKKLAVFTLNPKISLECHLVSHTFRSGLTPSAFSLHVLWVSFTSVSGSICVFESHWLCFRECMASLSRVHHGFTLFRASIPKRSRVLHSVSVSASVGTAALAYLAVIAA